MAGKINFALGHLAFSGGGVEVERLFSGTAIQVEGRMRSLSNAALKERTMISSNRELVGFDGWVHISSQFRLIGSFMFQNIWTDQAEVFCIIWSLDYLTKSILTPQNNSVIFCHLKT